MPRQSPPASVGFNPVILESLEERIAPAAMITFTDVDGDTVQLTTSKGTVAQLTTAAHVTNGQLRLLDFNNDQHFAGTNLTMKVITRGVTGDGLADVGLIDATGIDLGTVTVKGDIGKILAGDSNDATMGLKSLTADSIGTHGNITQGNAGNLDWVIHGGTSKFAVAHSVDGAALHWTSGGTLKVGSITIGGDLTGIGAAQVGDGSIRLTSATHADSIGSLKIAGSLIGDDTYSHTGWVAADQVGSVVIGGDLVGTSQANTGNLDIITTNPTITASIGMVTIGGSLRGGEGMDSGEIKATHDIASVKIGGSLIGGAGAGSGSISFASLGNTIIGGDLQGGAGPGTGAIFGLLGKNVEIGGSIIGGGNGLSGAINIAQLANITVDGDVIGGTAGFSGEILVSGALTGKLHLGGSLIGNALGVADAQTASGYIQVEGNTVEIDGSIIGGNNTTNVAIHDSGMIKSFSSVKSIIVHGSIVAGVSTNSIDHNLGAVRGQAFGSIQVDGSVTGNTTQDVMITGSGNSGSKTGPDLAIGKLTVNGNVLDTQILGGYSSGGTGINGNGAAANGGSAQLGTITILGNFIDSSIATGVNNHGFAWADAGDHNTLLPKIAGSNIVASIAKITIGGQANATTGKGLIGEQIKSFTEAGFAFPLGNAGILQAVNFNNFLHIRTFMAP